MRIHTKSRKGEAFFVRKRDDPVDDCFWYVYHCVDQTDRGLAEK